MDTNMRVLALSSSRAGNGDYLETARPFIQSLLGTAEQTIAFLPFASVDGDHTRYLQMVQQGLHGLPYHIQLVTTENARELVGNCQAIMTGGGNTFKLLHNLYSTGLVELVRTRVRSGTPYIGWSAGANIAGLTIGTTNDMPIVQPPSFNALGLLPFQLNPHYVNQVAEGFHGETRDQRLQEFVLMNPGKTVVALPEGTALQRVGGRLLFGGGHAGCMFKMDSGTIDKLPIAPGADLSYLLDDR